MILNDLDGFQMSEEEACLCEVALTYLELKEGDLESVEQIEA